MILPGTNVEIIVGDQLADLDPRRTRTVKVERIDEIGGDIMVRNPTTQRTSWLKARRLGATYGHKNGYRKVYPSTTAAVG